MADDPTTPGGEEGRDAGGLVDPRAPWEELVEDPTAPRALLAVMFTDIVGSTELATALGDRRWRELVEQHNAAVRREIARFGGREVDTAGDSFFATFDLPIRAVDCALEAVRAVRRLGLRIRAGVHMGECVLSGGTVRGVTVHIGARVGAKATGGQVLVSSTVRDMLAGAGLTFRERGEHVLKGVDGRWRLYAVQPRTLDAEADLPPLLETGKAAPAPLWRRRPIVTAATALAVVVAAIAFVVTRGPGGLSSVAADSVASIDAASGAVTSAVKVGARPVGLAATSDGVWVANSFERSVSHVSSDGRTVRSIGGLGAGPTATAVGARYVFVANADEQTISRVSIDTRQEVSPRIRSGNGLSDLAFGAGALWITNSVDGTVWRIDPASGAQTASIPVGPAIRGIVVTDQAVWVTSESAHTLTRIDPKSAKVVGVTRVGNGSRAVAVGAGAVWVANAFDGTVSRVGISSGRVEATIPAGRGARSIAFSKGRVVVANEEDATVSIIDPGSNRAVRTIRMNSVPMGLAAGGDRVWVSVRGGVERYRGGTLRMGTAIHLQEDPQFSLDPAWSATQLAIAIIPATHDGLLGFKKVGGVEGSEVLPNLAEDLRPPTDDGTTYSFTLRKGLKYSNGTPVLASHVRKSFERLFLTEAPFAVLLAVLKGADGCSPQACDLSAGVETDDAARTIVFHLRLPVADFPSVLALPIATVVPPDTPVANQLITPIPGTGPYRYKSVTGDIKTGGEAVLERNPHFTPRGGAQPGGYPDEIVLTWGGTPTAHVEAVKAGREDFTIDVQEGEIDVPAIATEVPAQFHLFDIPSVFYAVLNEKTPPFNDVRARKAFNYAVDRRKFVEAFGGPLFATESCQILPRNISGHVPYCPYTVAPNELGTWTGPDLATARRLVQESGTAGTRVTVWKSDFYGDNFNQISSEFVDTLNGIGYRADQRIFKGDFYQALLTGSPALQVAMTGWLTDYPAPSSFFLPLLACRELTEKVTGDPEASFNLGQFCFPEVDQRIERALVVQRDDPAAASRLWAEVDRLIADAAPWVTLGTARFPVLVSSRVRNLQMSPAIGPLLTQMWIET